MFSDVHVTVWNENYTPNGDFGVHYVTVRLCWLRGFTGFQSVLYIDASVS